MSRTYTESDRQAFVDRVTAHVGALNAGQSPPLHRITLRPGQTPAGLLPEPAPAPAPPRAEGRSPAVIEAEIGSLRLQLASAKQTARTASVAPPAPLPEPVRSPAAGRVHSAREQIEALRVENAELFLHGSKLSQRADELQHELAWLSRRRRPA